jgi:hypothetical protein
MIVDSTVDFPIQTTSTILHLVIVKKNGRVLTLSMLYTCGVDSVGDK